MNPARSAALVVLVMCSLSASAAPKPNFIFIYCDNLGNGDIGCFGSKLHRTPNVDRMAAEGRKFTSFYVSSGVCTPSRASAMTGCYSQRVNLHESETGGVVLQPVARKGLHPDEVTIAEVLGQQGYATAIIGKWHLGDQPEFLPTRQGFDFFYGIPYSDDMTAREGKPWPPLPLMRNEQVIDAPVDRDLLTQQYTQQAIRFMTLNRDRPFFLYLPHAMPGSTPTPYSSPEFKGKSKNGLYGDSVEEIDWSTGEILKTLKTLGIDDRTLVVWTSDNGAVNRTPTQGSCLPYKGWGYETSEGAMRMPCVMRWPGKIPAGTTTDELVTTMDLLPTFARLAGSDAPQGRKIDGSDARPILFGESGAKSAYDETGFFYYRIDQLQAVRSGPWKLYLPLAEKYINNSRKTASSKAELYNVRDDVGEEKEVSASQPDVVKRLTALADAAREDLGDKGKPGKGQRPAGMVKEATPRVK